MHVAAGMPISVTKAAATTVAQRRDAGSVARLARNHRVVVATEAQVPGPGFKRPMPKKVATTVAQMGVRGRDAPATAGGTPALRSGVAATLAASLWLAVGDSSEETDWRFLCTSSLHLREHYFVFPLPRPSQATIPRTRRWPISQDRGGGSARHRRESRRWKTLPASCRWGIEA